MPETAAFEEIARGIHLLKSPFAGIWSGIFLVSRRRRILIDSGANASTVDGCLAPALSRLGLAPGDIELLLNTHTHGDHIGGHFRLRQLAPSMETATFRGSLDKLRDPLKYSKLIRARFPDDSPPPPAVLQGVEPDSLLDDGAQIDTGDGALRLIHSPGHDDDCVCLYDDPTGTLLCGDSIQGDGTCGQGLGFYQDLAAYRASLRRLSGLDAATLAAGHSYRPFGHLVDGPGNVKASIENCLFLTELYDRFIAEAWESGLRGRHEIAKFLIARLKGRPPERMFLALYTCSEHLKSRLDDGK